MTVKFIITPGNVSNIVLVDKTTGHCFFPQGDGKFLEYEYKDKLENSNEECQFYNIREGDIVINGDYTFVMYKNTFHYVPNAQYDVQSLIEYFKVYLKLQKPDFIERTFDQDVAYSTAKQALLRVVTSIANNDLDEIKMVKEIMEEHPINIVTRM